jgi:excisionase family DNA binding protein
MADIERKLLTAKEAADLLHVTDETIRRYVDAGTLEGFRLPGNYVRVFADSVTALMNGGSK